MKEPHHQRKVGIGMIMVAASLGAIGILQLAIGPDVLFADNIQREQVELFEDCKTNDFQDPQCAKWLDEMKLQVITYKGSKLNFLRIVKPMISKIHNVQSG